MVYDQGDQVSQAASVYRCVTPHRSRETFEDDLALWEEILDQGLEKVSDQVLEHKSSLGINPASSSFFLTPQGQRVADAAVEIAHTHLARLHLTQNLHLRLPFPYAQDLKVGRCVRVQDPRLMAHAQQGIVKEIVTTFCGQSGGVFSQLTLSLMPACVLWPMVPCDPSLLPPTLRITPSGFRYEAYDSQLPDDGDDAPTGGRGPVITHLSLSNGPHAQELALKSAVLKSAALKSQALQSTEKDAEEAGTTLGGELGLNLGLGTGIILRLGKIQPRETLCHTITLKLDQ
jgi:hypothetical protein